MNKKGKFIVIDGGEGCGKSTLIENFLKKRFDSGGFLWTKEPGGTPLGNEIRKWLLAPEARAYSPEVHFLLQWGQRAEHMKSIKARIDEGIHVISDRGDSSTYAYQIVAQGATRLEPLFWEVGKAVYRDIEPDLYIFLDIDPKIALARIAARKQKTHFDDAELAFHESVRNGFRQFAKEAKVVTIDAMELPHEVAKDTVLAIESVIGS